MAPFDFLDNGFKLNGHLLSHRESFVDAFNV